MKDGNELPEPVALVTQIAEGSTVFLPRLSLRIETMIPLFTASQLQAEREAAYREGAQAHRMAFCPACFVQVSATEADQQTLDARRYRWLRDEGNTLDGNEPFLAGTDLDEAIDAAIRSEAPREKGPVPGDMPALRRADDLTAEEAKRGYGYRQGVRVYCCYGMYADAGHSSECRAQREKGDERGR